MAWVARADFHRDGSRRVTVKSRSPASSRLSATMSHVAPSVRATMANALQPPFPEERLAARLDLALGLGLDHVAAVFARRVARVPGRMREQVARLVNRAALGRNVRPRRGQPTVGKTAPRTVS
jgi:hypothetical protein